MGRSFFSLFAARFNQKPVIDSSLKDKREKKLLKRIFRKNRLLGYDDEKPAREAIQIVENYTMISVQRLITLWQQVKHVDRQQIPGCFVECGTWRGGACGMMALAHLKFTPHPNRHLHLFDSFEGLPEPSQEKDGEEAAQYSNYQSTGSLKSIHRCVGTLEQNQRLINNIIHYPQELTHYHVGWFQDTVPAAKDAMGGIAILRLDGDWYESTKICLETLYPQVVRGGFVIVDDYGRWTGCKTAVDEYFQRLGTFPYLHHIDDNGRYIQVP